ncbi:MAG: holo-ACP synthase [Gaiellales bacterium]|nr:MAG: holo-ACP synthase [Gaiellales bacterium]
MRVGVDIVEHKRFARALERHPGIIERVFTVAEREYCRSRPNPLQHFAARFAAKEAVGKAIGTGVRSWQEIEVTGPGSPGVSVTGRMGQAAAQAGIGGLALSMSHSASVSVSVVIATGKP